MIKIHNVFRNAGKIYGWEGSGVGIQMKELGGDGILQVDIAGTPHKIDKLLARVIINKYKSTYTKPGIPQLGILPMSEMLPM